MKYYKNGIEVKRANTVKQRLNLLNKYTGDKYTVFENAYYGYAIFKNGEKIFDTLNQKHFQNMIGSICYKLNLTDVYSNITVQ